MNTVSNFSIWGGGWTGWVLPTLLGLGLVVFIHELGHFLVARLCGVRVLVFSVGFGREIAGFTDRLGTRWKLSAIPLGGYVKFFGDENAASVPDQTTVENMTAEEREKSFFHQPLGRRAAIVAAGPGINFILAIVIFAIVLALKGQPFATPQIDSVVPNSAAAAAGFQAGDVIRSIDGRKIENFFDMQRIVSASAKRTLTIEVDRGGIPMTLTPTPNLTKGRDVFGNFTCQGTLGVQTKNASLQGVPLSSAVPLALSETWNIVDRTFSFIAGLARGTECPDQVGGVWKIAEVSGQVATQGFLPWLHLVGVLSVSIGLFNLFPVPLLDGGHLMFYLIEAVMRRPLSPRAQEIGFRIGFALVVMLMIFTFFNDITQWLAKPPAS